MSRCGRPRRGRISCVQRWAHACGGNTGSGTRRWVWIPDRGCGRRSRSELPSRRPLKRALGIERRTKRLGHERSNGCVFCGMGWSISTKDDKFESGADFPAECVRRHINSKEMFAIHEVLAESWVRRPARLRGAQVLVDVDNRMVVRCFTEGSAKNP